MATDTMEGADRKAREKPPLALLLSLAGAACLLFLLLVWPTLYRYPSDSDRHRVNRLTGKSQVFDRKAEAWRPARGRNSRGTEGSPYDDRGPRSEGPAPGGEWWHDGSGSGSGSGSESRSGSRRPKGKQWWYSEGEADSRSEPPSEGSPIGSSRGRGGGGDAGDGGDRESGGSPIGGSRSGGRSPIGGGGSGGGSPIGGD